jgi:hypothetical protein
MQNELAALKVLPLAVGSGAPVREVEGFMAIIIILGGIDDLDRAKSPVASNPCASVGALREHGSRCRGLATGLAVASQINDILFTIRDNRGGNRCFLLVLFIRLRCVWESKLGC